MNRLITKSPFNVNLLGMRKLNCTHAPRTATVQCAIYANGSAFDSVWGSKWRAPLLLLKVVKNTKRRDKRTISKYNLWFFFSWRLPAHIPLTIYSPFDKNLHFFLRFHIFLLFTRLWIEWSHFVWILWVWVCRFGPSVWLSVGRNVCANCAYLWSQWLVSNSYTALQLEKFNRSSCTHNVLCATIRNRTAINKHRLQIAWGGWGQCFFRIVCSTQAHTSVFAATITHWNHVTLNWLLSSSSSSSSSLPPPPSPPSLL